MLIVKINETYYVDLSPGKGEEMSGIRKCKIEKIYNDKLIRVIPYSYFDNKYHEDHSRTIDVKRLIKKCGDAN